MAFQSLTQEYLQMPVVTRAYTTACVLTTTAVESNLKFSNAYISAENEDIEILISGCECFNYFCHLDIVSPFQLYFNPTLILKHYHFWRLITTFLYFGSFGFNFFFNMVFTYRYCRMLEEGSFRSRTADFVVMFLFGGVCMICCAFFTNLLFLGQAFTIMLVYVWARRNPHLRMNFFGLLNFQAPFLPWVLLIFSVLLGNTVIVDFLGMGVGHLYFFLEDVFPSQEGGFRVLKTPSFLKALFDNQPIDPDYNPLPEDRPGGFDWGEGDAQPRD